jgi:ADP-heptose:LPS heptosyltransferase
VSIISTFFYLDMKKILVIQTASIGDVILMTSLLEKLHSTYENAQLDVLIKKGNETLFAFHPYISNVIIWNKKENKYKNLLSVINRVRSNKYDMVFNLQRFFSSGLITVLSKSKQTVGFKKNPLSLFFSKRVEHNIGKQGVHEVQRNMKLLEGFCDKEILRPKLYPSKTDYAKMSEYKLEPYYTLSPSSLWQTKRLQLDKWVEVFKNMDKNSSLYLLGAKEDYKDCEWIRKELKNYNCVNLAGKLTFLQSAALMKDAKMNFVNDSSPLHLCSAMNAKVTAVFCSTVPEFGFTPLSDDKLIVETKEKLSCRPCGLHGKKTCKEGNFLCSNTIDTTLLINRL